MVGVRPVLVSLVQDKIHELSGRVGRLVLPRSDGWRESKSLAHARPHGLSHEIPRLWVIHQTQGVARARRRYGPPVRRHLRVELAFHPSAVPHKHREERLVFGPNRGKVGDVPQTREHLARRALEGSVGEGDAAAKPFSVPMGPPMLTCGWDDGVERVSVGGSLRPHRKRATWVFWEILQIVGRAKKASRVARGYGSRGAQRESRGWDGRTCRLASTL